MSANLSIPCLLYVVILLLTIHIFQLTDVNVQNDDHLTYSECLADTFPQRSEALAYKPDLWIFDFDWTTILFWFASVEIGTHERRQQEVQSSAAGYRQLCLGI